MDSTSGSIRNSCGEADTFSIDMKKRAELNGICSQCRQKGKMRRSLLRNGARVICPVCGKELTARPIGKMPAYGCDESSTVLVQMAGNRLLLRFFHIRKYYSKEKPEAYDPYRKEYLRLFYEEGRWERYEWAYSSCYPGKGWVPERYGFDDDKVVLCPIQLKEAITQERRLLIAVWRKPHPI